MSSNIPTNLISMLKPKRHILCFEYSNILISPHWVGKFHLEGQIAYYIWVLALDLRRKTTSRLFDGILIHISGWGVLTWIWDEDIRIFISYFPCYPRLKCSCLWKYIQRKHIREILHNITRKLFYSQFFWDIHRRDELRGVWLLWLYVRYLQGIFYLTLGEFYRKIINISRTVTEFLWSVCGLWFILLLSLVLIWSGTHRRRLQTSTSV